MFLIFLIKTVLSYILFHTDDYQNKKIKNMLQTYKGFEKKEKEHCFHFTALVKDFPQNIKIVLLNHLHSF